jgi:hypothetical protein
VLQRPVADTTARFSRRKIFVGGISELNEDDLKVRQTSPVSIQPIHVDLRLGNHPQRAHQTRCAMQGDMIEMLARFSCKLTLYFTRVRLFHPDLF